MSVKLLTLDVETTLNAPEDMGKSHPMHPKNYIVLLGTMSSKGDGKIISLHETLMLSGLIEDIAHFKPDFIVGCNISFDLLYCYAAGRGMPEGKNYAKLILQEQRLWDIQLAEYLLTGQQSKWASLDEMSLKYGLPVKDDAVTKYFAAGIGAEKVPMVLLKPYLQQDLENTEAIAIKQMELATTAKMFDLIISQMEALHATTEMMFNGLAFDETYFRTYTVEVAEKYVDQRLGLQKDLKLIPDNHYQVEDINSALQWSKLLFGGTKKEAYKEAVGIFKNGKTKFKVMEREIACLPLCEIVPPDEWKSEKTGKVSVDEKILVTLATLTKREVVQKLCSQLLGYRETSKQLTTYIQGLGKHVIEYDKCTYIHGRLNHVATSTGRLSSTSPNLQNISNNPIKKTFVSRYKGGVLVEFDFSQLEVAILAHVTGDKTLISDIVSGKDIHSELFYDMNKKRPTDEERKWFKRLTFGLIYGAGPTTLAENAGCDFSVAKKFITTFYTRYPEVQKWHYTMQIQANRCGLHDKSATGEHELARTWRWASPTGRIYVFREYKNTYHLDREYNFSPTELKNYPIQGLATGDIVPMMLGVLFRKFVNRTGVCLVNTVHDSIMFDVSPEAIASGLLKEVTDVLNNTHMYYEKTFEHPLALKLTASASVGTNWFITEKV